MLYFWKGQFPTTTLNPPKGENPSLTRCSKENQKSSSLSIQYLVPIFLSIFFTFNRPGIQQSINTNTQNRNPLIAEEENHKAEELFQQTRAKHLWTFANNHERTILAEIERS